MPVKPCVSVPLRRTFWLKTVSLVVFLFASPERRLHWGVRVGPPAVKGSPEGGFITLVWRAESELVLEKKQHAV